MRQNLLTQQDRNVSKESAANQGAASTAPTALVIFGVTGDLAHRKLVPALYELMHARRLPRVFHTIGFARRDWNDETMRSVLSKGVKEISNSRPIDDEALNRLLESMHFVRSDFDDRDGYVRLRKQISDLEVENCMFYLAAPPETYQTIVESIGEVGLQALVPGWTRIVVEKPYGRDLDSARELDQIIHRVFDESQVYRIDHYLGKETVQNILVFRFANAIFDPIWNRRYVDHVQITVAETVGVGTRAGYYETAGVIRDIFQNHVLQLLSLVGMEAPVAFNADAVRDEKVKVLRALRPLKGADVLDNTFRAQYVSGTVDGKRVRGYKDETAVSQVSTTETYLAARVFIDNWRWAGVPFYLRSGKALPVRATQVIIHFKQVPLSLFDWRNLAGAAPNRLAINIQPDEGIILTFGAKAPGPINQIEPVQMSFDYVETFGGEPPEAYERLLMDVLTGDATLFTRKDEVAAAWKFIDGIIEGWLANPVRNLAVYEAGTWGPPGADDFIQRDGRSWIML
ncbi:MAG: glucose-6-phosphate dehydrogenase [Chloroflexota bacterium]|nr:MAG: glucose-6-phosphate dehydrogenase [Chloroflexota bacterium]